MDTIVTLKLFESVKPLCFLKYEHSRIDQRKFIEFFGRSIFAIEDDSDGDNVSPGRIGAGTCLPALLLVFGCCPIRTFFTGALR